MNNWGPQLGGEIRVKVVVGVRVGVGFMVRVGVGISIYVRS